MNTSMVSGKRPAFNWFFKYKLHHIPFWLVYHYLWWFVTIGTPVDIFHSPYASKYLFYVVFQALGVYFNLYVLIPRFLEKGHYVSYISILLLTILVIAACIVTGYYFSSWLAEIPFREMYNRDPADYMFFFQINTLPSTAASMTLAMSIKLTKNWIQTRQRQQLLEKEKLETELKFLRSQINPHFLFNTINSIFVLIHKNPLMASESLAKFSDLLRYQLYECNENQIPLRQEINYLENFIELQRLRQDSDRIDVHVDIPGYLAADYTIAPFVLMPFIENAFKHVSKRNDQNNWIRLQLQVLDHQLVFSISNSVSAMYNASPEVIPHGGIGLTNVRRRLDLLYPEKYSLDIRENPAAFHVCLTLMLATSRNAEPVELSLSQN